jgi:hypothetical protein
MSGTKRRTFLVHILLDRDDSSKAHIEGMVSQYHESHCNLGLSVSLTEAESPACFKQKADLVDLRIVR